MDIKFTGTAIVLQDTHHPYHDQRALHEVEVFIGEYQPDLLIYPGDMSDFYGLSKFDKNPNRRGKLQAELNLTASMFGRHRKLAPNARMIFEFGNHEDRLRRHLWKNDEELESLDCLRVPELYKLRDSEVECVDYEEGVMINGVFMVTHSDLIRAHSGYTAKGMSDKHGGSGLHGHSHRLGSYYKRNRFGVYGWWENGCLCDLNPDYVTNPNWQQGFSLVHFTKDRFWVEQCQIINRKFMYAGIVYGSGGKKRVEV